MLKMRVNAKKYLNVRAEPRADAEVVDRLKRGDEVLVDEIKDGWAKMAKGYCVARFLEIVAFEMESRGMPEQEPAEEPEQGMPNHESAKEPAGKPRKTEPTDGDPKDAGELENMTVPDLRKLAEESDIPIPPSARKADIIAAILDD